MVRWIGPTQNVDQEGNPMTTKVMSSRIALPKSKHQNRYRKVQAGFSLRHRLLIVRHMRVRCMRARRFRANRIKAKPTKARRTRVRLTRPRRTTAKQPQLLRRPRRGDRRRVGHQRQWRKSQDGLVLATTRPLLQVGTALQLSR